MSEPSRLRDDGTTDTFERSLLGSAALDREPEDGAARALAALGLATAAVGVGAAAKSATGQAAAAGTSVAAKLTMLVLATGALIGGMAALAASGGTTQSATPAIPSLAAEAPPVPPPTITRPLEPEAQVVAVAVTDLPSASAPVVPARRPERSSRSGGAASKKSVADELALIDEARAAIRAGEIGRAQKTLDTYDARYAGGTLSLEAKLARIELHLVRSEHDEARVLCERFLAEHPASTYDRRVRVLLQRARSERTIVE